MSVVFFTHVQRTGGTSIRELLARNYGFKHFLNASTGTVSEFVNLKYQGKLKCVGGHLYYGVHELLGCPNPVYLTLLRNPAERMVSYYFRSQETTQASYHNLVKEMSLPEFCRSGRVTHNGATAAISGYDYKTRGLQKALGNMEKYLLVGIQEMFLESAFLLCKKLKFRNWLVGKINYTNRIAPSEEIIRIVSELEADDVALYEEARKRFVAEMAKLSAEEKALLQSYRRIHEKLYEGPPETDENSSTRDKLVVKGGALELMKAGGIAPESALQAIPELHADVERLNKYFAAQAR